MLPQTNARLVLISPPGATEDWDQPAGAAGTPKWQGDEDAYVIEKVRTNYSQAGGGLVKQRDIQIIISGNLRTTDNQPLTINTGDLITYNWRGIQHTRRVMEYSAPFMPTLPLQNFVRLHLNPEALETALEGE